MGRASEESIRNHTEKLQEAARRVMEIHIANLEGIFVSLRDLANGGPNGAEWDEKSADYKTILDLFKITLDKIDGLALDKRASKLSKVFVFFFNVRQGPVWVGRGPGGGGVGGQVFRTARLG